LAGLQGPVKAFLDNGADANAQGGIYHTAPQAASSQAHEAVVRLLLEHKVDIHAKDNNGWTALHLAVKSLWEEVVLEHKAITNAKTGNGDGAVLGGYSLARGDGAAVVGA
jgi:ankyrin repeat protein